MPFPNGLISLRVIFLKTKALIIIILLIALILALMLAHSPAYAQGSAPLNQESLILTDEQGQYPLGLYLDILEDPSGQLTIAEVTSPEYAARFERSQVDVPIYGYTNSTFWLRMGLRNETSLTNQWLLETNFQNLNYVDLYLPSEQGGYWVKESGALRPFDTRDIPYYHVVFKLPLESQAEQTFYIRVESGSSMTLAFTLWESESFAIDKISDMLGIGLFYGALLIMLIYQLFTFYSLREANYLYFVLFLASSILFWATYEGIADQFLWPGLSEEKLPLMVITMSLFFMTALKFSDVFLEQKTRSPRLHWLFYLLIGLWGLMIVIVPFFSYGFMAKLTSVLILLTPVLAALAGIYSWRKGFHPARFYLISWLGYLAGVLIIELVRLGVLPSTPITEKAYHIGLLWLVLMWSWALADRINQLRTQTEKARAQTEEANRLLRNSQSRLSQILEGMPLGVVVYGKDAKPNYVNQRAVEILSNPVRGIWAGIAGGRTVAQAMEYFSFRVAGSDQAYPLENMPVNRALQGEPASVDNIEADLVDRRVPLEIWASPIKDDHGNVETAIVAFQDITQRKMAETELIEYRDHLEKMVELRTTELSAINDQLNREATERKFLEEMLHKRIEWLSAVNSIHQSISGLADLPKAYRQLSASITQLMGASGAFIGMLDEQRHQIEIICRTQPDGSLPIEKRAPLLIQKDSSLQRDIEQGKLLILSADQITTLPAPLVECFQAEELQSVILAPTETRQGLTILLGLGLQQPVQAITPKESDLIKRIVIDLAILADDARLFENTQALVATEERNRLARDLHDSVTQVLFSASLVAEVLPQIWKRDPEMAQQSLDELRRLTHGALAEMRTMLLELRPSALIKTPLGELLAQLTEAITSRSGLPFQLFIEKIPSIPEEVHTSFYRVAQEGLNNVVKHAQASLVTVSLSATPASSEPGDVWEGEVKLVIKDNGRGFSLQNEHAEHMGLSIIRERAALINARVSIDSQSGLGTVLTLVWNN